MRAIFIFFFLFHHPFKTRPIYILHVYNNNNMMYTRTPTGNTFFFLSLLLLLYNTCTHARTYEPLLKCTVCVFLYARNAFFFLFFFFFFYSFNAPRITHMAIVSNYITISFPFFTTSFAPLSSVPYCYKHIMYYKYCIAPRYVRFLLRFLIRRPDT